MTGVPAAQGVLGSELVVVSDAEVVRARDYVARTGLVDLLGPLLTARRRSPAGRRRTLTLEALLVGLLLTAVVDRNVLLSRVNVLLHHRLTPESRRLLGVPDRPATPASLVASYAVVRRLFHAVVDLFDDSPNPRNRKLTEEEFASRLTPMTAAERVDLRGLRDRIGNALLAPSYGDMLDVLRAYPATGSCVDATPLRTNVRRPSRTGTVSADPDAALYLRTSEGSEPDTLADTAAKTRKDTRKKQKKVVRELFGYEATLLVNGVTRPVDGRVAAPVLVGGYTLERPGHRPGGAAVDVPRQAVGHGWPTGLLAADRAYNNSQPGEFHFPARALGFRLLFDYRDGQLGVQAEHAGAIQVEGRWSCPNTPTAVINATAAHREGLIDEDT